MRTAYEKNKLSKEAKEVLHSIPLGGYVVKSQLVKHLGLPVKTVTSRIRDLRGTHMRRTTRKVGKEVVWRRVA